MGSDRVADELADVIARIVGKDDYGILVGRAVSSYLRENPDVVLRALGAWESWGPSGLPIWAVERDESSNTPPDPAPGASLLIYDEVAPVDDVLIDKIKHLPPSRLWPKSTD